MIEIVDCHVYFVCWKVRALFLLRSENGDENRQKCQTGQQHRKNVHDFQLVDRSLRLCSHYRTGELLTSL